MNTKMNALMRETKSYNWRIAKKGKFVLNYCTAMVLFSALTPVATQAGPVGGQIVDGQGSIRTEGTTTNINQSTDWMLTHWQDFSSQVNETINFNQPGATSTAVNKVIGNVPSDLRGALNANGRVFILNDSGVTFHDTSKVNVGALLATTSSDFTREGDKIAFTGDSNAAVINRGDIIVSDGGFAVLAAPYVSNEGLVRANLGTIELASATEFTLDLRGDGLITYGVSDSAAKKLGIRNTGTLEAQSGTINVNAKAASELVNSVVNLGGVVDADSFTTDGKGGVVMVASDGDIINTADIRANADTKGNGGKVVTVAKNTNRFEKGASITARGGSEAGDGGFIEVSGKQMAFNGTASAAATNGTRGKVLIDPAFLEIRDGAGTSDTSGDTSWVYEETVETISQGGSDVELDADSRIELKDLTDNTLEGGEGDIKLTTDGDDCGTGCVTGIVFEDKDDTIQTTTGHIILKADHGNIDIGNLETGGTGIDTPGQIVIEAKNGSIATRDLTITGEGEADISMELRAGEDITVDGKITAMVTDLASSAWSNLMASVGMLAGGDIQLKDDVTISTKAESAKGASLESILDVNADGNVTVDGDILVTADADVSANKDVADSFSGAYATLNAGENITLEKDTEVSAKLNTESTKSVATTSTEAMLSLAAGETSDTGDLTVKGDLTVTADTDAESDGSCQGDVAKTTADANATLIAARNLTVEGDAKVDASATATGQEVSKTQTNAVLEASGGTKDTDGTIEFKNKLDVAALAEGFAEEVSHTFAEALGNLFGPADITLSNDVTVTANSAGNASDQATKTETLATFNAITDKVNSGADVSLAGDLVVDATSTTTGEEVSGVNAEGVTCLVASGDTTVDGDATITGNATNGATDEGSKTHAESMLHVVAGRGDHAGNITINGNGTSRATSTANEGADEIQAPTAAAYGNIIANGDVTIDGQTTIESIIDFAGAESYDEADTFAQLVVNANGNDSVADAGNITITDDVLVNASLIQNVDDGEGGTASADADFVGKFDVTVEDVLSRATVENSTKTCGTYAEATLDIEAGLTSGSGDAAFGTIGTEAMTYAKGTSFAHTRVAAADELLFNSSIDPKAEADGAFVQQKVTGDDTDKDDFAELILRPGKSSSSSGSSSGSTSGGSSTSSSSGSTSGGSSTSSSSGSTSGGSSTSSSSGSTSGGSSTSSSSGSTSGGSSTSSSSGSTSGGSSTSSSSGSTTNEDINPILAYNPSELDPRLTRGLTADQLGALSPAAGGFCENVNVDNKFLPQYLRKGLCRNDYKVEEELL
ncbi:MAG: filamentous hemagglutinin N-terminal domain-containing protein [Hyphomicrobiales bacterium]|nr:filamentous hemagglutinin N-terminal domain-containing protein [Hyphomicrobiales bacterium]